jgi:hypothetical protein
MPFFVFAATVVAPGFGGLGLHRLFAGGGRLS